MTSTLHPHRIAVKLARKGGEGPLEATPFIAFFHRAIQQASLEGLLLDVADYRHVPNGPSVMLIGHEVDYVIDQTGGEVGLLVVRKRCEGAPLATLLHDTLRKAFGAAAAINAEAVAGLEISTEHYEVQLLDRSAVSHDDAGAEALRVAIAPVFGELFELPFEIARSTHEDPRSPLALSVSVPGAPTAAELHASAPSTGRPRPRQASVGDPQSAWDIDVEELKRMRDAGEAFRLIDVREAAEFEAANLDGQLIPLGTLGEKLTELGRDERHIVHCRSGARSAKAVEQLRAAGFEDVWNVRGGILAWSDRIDPSVPKT